MRMYDLADQKPEDARPSSRITKFLAGAAAFYVTCMLCILSVRLFVTMSVTVSDALRHIGWPPSTIERLALVLITDWWLLCLTLAAFAGAVIGFYSFIGMCRGHLRAYQFATLLMGIAFVGFALWANRLLSSPNHPSFAETIAFISFCGAVLSAKVCRERKPMD